MNHKFEKENKKKQPSKNNEEIPHAYSEEYTAYLQSAIGNQAIQRMVENGSETEPSTYTADTILQRVSQRMGTSTTTTPSGSSTTTKLPEEIKSGMETLSGISLDDVNVHTNSDKPAQVNALAYTKGNEIYVAPGEEKHLPHEAWHVVQQKQGRVKPTTNLRGNPINDSPALEKEADQMGAKAVQMKSKESDIHPEHKETTQDTVQMMMRANGRQTRIQRIQGICGNAPTHDTVFDAFMRVLRADNFQYVPQSPPGTNILNGSNQGACGSLRMALNDAFEQCGLERKTEEMTARIYCPVDGDYITPGAPGNIRGEHAYYFGQHYYLEGYDPTAGKRGNLNYEHGEESTFAAWRSTLTLLQRISNVFILNRLERAVRSVKQFNNFYLFYMEAEHNYVKIRNLAEALAAAPDN